MRSIKFCGIKVIKTTTQLCLKFGFPKSGQFWILAPFISQNTLSKDNTTATTVKITFDNGFEYKW